MFPVVVLHRVFHPCNEDDHAKDMKGQVRHGRPSRITGVGGNTKVVS